MTDILTKIRRPTKFYQNRSDFVVGQDTKNSLLLHGIPTTVRNVEDTTETFLVFVSVHSVYGIKFSKEFV